MSSGLPTSRLGRTDVRPTRLGLGTAPLGGWPSPITEEEGLATIRAAWDSGVRHYDTSPFYGYGQAERWLGQVLAELPRDQLVVSTKVGRTIRPLEAGEPQLFQGAGELSTDFDFSSDATLRSIDESLGRLGLDRVDVVLIHDPEDHLDEAVSGAYQALDRLRAEGTVRAIGAGMNWPAPMAELVRRTDLDCVLLAGRYSLLEHGALDELFPLLERRGIGALIGGALNSGVLADPRPGATFHYAEAPTQVLQRARAIEQICSSHGVPLAAAALQFPLGHPVVTAVVCGARTPGEASQNAELVTMDIPPGLWEELIGTHHLPVGVPIG